jgi:prepilin-type N-terminal cleavage/methylation domain-containing protein
MQRGFSLLELLLALAMVSILGAISFPALARWHSHALLKSEGTRLSLALEDAYVAALSYGETITVGFDRNVVQTIRSSGAPLATYSPRKGVSVSNKSTDQGNLTFYPTHTATPATVVITSPYGECEVVVSLRGRVRSTC